MCAFRDYNIEIVDLCVELYKHIDTADFSLVVVLEGTKPEQAKVKGDSITVLMSKLIRLMTSGESRRARCRCELQSEK